MPDHPTLTQARNAVSSQLTARHTARAMADRWDAAQCPARWTIRESQPDMFDA